MMSVINIIENGDTCLVVGIRGEDGVIIPQESGRAELLRLAKLGEKEGA